MLIWCLHKTSLVIPIPKVMQMCQHVWCPTQTPPPPLLAISLFGISHRILSFQVCKLRKWLQLKLCVNEALVHQCLMPKGIPASGWDRIFHEKLQYPISWGCEDFSGWLNHSVSKQRVENILNADTSIQFTRVCWKVWEVDQMQWTLRWPVLNPTEDK